MVRDRLSLRQEENADEAPAKPQIRLGFPLSLDRSLQ